MDETRQLVDALKRCLKMRGLTYRTLAERVGLSEASGHRYVSVLYLLEEASRVPARALDA